MKIKTAETAIEMMFNEYLEKYSDKWSDLDREQQDTFYAYQDKIKAGEADPEELADVQYMALRAGFHAGFKIAEKLAAEAETK